MGTGMGFLLTCEGEENICIPCFSATLSRGKVSEYSEELKAGWNT